MGSTHLGFSNLFYMPYVWQSDKILLKLSAHPKDVVFNEARLKDLLEFSVSISILEKKALIDNVCLFSQGNIDELLRVLEAENSKFAELSKNGTEKDLQDISSLRAKKAEEWKEIEEFYS